MNATNSVKSDSLPPSIPVYTFTKGQRVRINPLRRKGWHPFPDEIFVIKDIQSIEGEKAQMYGSKQMIELEGYPGGKIWTGWYLEPVN